MPPATVITTEIDPLRSKGQAYPQWLREAGSPLRTTNYNGVTHEFFGTGAKRQPGLTLYLQKRDRLIRAGIHLVEIDLLRRTILNACLIRQKSKRPAMDDAYMLSLLAAALPDLIENSDPSCQ